MVRTVLTAFIIFLVVMSIVPAFADTGTMSVVSGKTFQVSYNANGVKILSIYTSSSELLGTVQVLNPKASIELTMPRSLIDSKDGNNDIPFIVLVDGIFVNATEKNPTTATRTVSIPLDLGNQRIEIIGTFVATSGPSGASTQPASPVSNLPSAITPTINSSSPMSPSTPSTPSVVPKASPPTASIPKQVMPKNITAQTNASQSISFSIPYLHGATINLSYIDLAVIGAICLVVIIVIASAARKKPSKIAKRNV